METRNADYITSRRVTGRVETIGAHAVFGEVIGLVALTLACAALGAYLAPDIGRTAAIGCSIAGCVSLCLTDGAARRSEYLACRVGFRSTALRTYNPRRDHPYRLLRHDGEGWSARAPPRQTGTCLLRELSATRRAKQH